MSVLQMQRISICAMKKDRKAILKDLQGFGAIEIETSKAGGDGLTKIDTLEADFCSGTGTRCSAGKDPGKDLYVFFTGREETGRAG